MRKILTSINRIIFSSSHSFLPQNPQPPDVLFGNCVFPAFKIPTSRCIKLRVRLDHLSQLTSYFATAKESRRNRTGIRELSIRIDHTPSKVMPYSEARNYTSQSTNTTCRYKITNTSVKNPSRVSEERYTQITQEQYPKLRVPCIRAIMPFQKLGRGR